MILAVICQLYLTLSVSMVNSAGTVQCIVLGATAVALLLVKPELFELMCNIDEGNK